MARDLMELTENSNTTFVKVKSKISGIATSVL